MANKKITAKTEKKAVEKIVLVSLSTTELGEKAKKLRQEIEHVKMQIKIGRVKNVRKGFHLHKELARVLTVLSDKMANKYEKH